MEILSAEQVRLWDQFTIEKEPISSVDLMERAAMSCYNWLEENKFLERTFCIFCGKGNNGGDGLALARLLASVAPKVIVYILEFGHKGTPEFQVNLARLHLTEVDIRFVQTIESLHTPAQDEIFIDALYGTGLNRPLEGLSAAVISYINQSGNKIIAIDIPSGMYTDKSSLGNAMVQANHTFSFQCYKEAFLVAENEACVGSLHILDIGLLPEYPLTINPQMKLIDLELIRTLYKPRTPFAHKGMFGHALLVAGSYGKMGAALLAAEACLRSGTGLLTCRIPRAGYAILQTALPEAMANVDEQENLVSGLPQELSNFRAIGVGPGIGTDEKTASMLATLFKTYSLPVVLDADALNLLAAKPELLSGMPPYSILTPHPKEFDRLFGSSSNDFDRISRARAKSIKHRCIILLKGHRSFVALPEGPCYFNFTGNAGMAKGGTGDALTGIITALLAQGYIPAHAALLGVYIHGLAGDFASGTKAEESMLASDLIDSLGKAFLLIASQKN